MQSQDTSNLKKEFEKPNLTQEKMQIWEKSLDE